MIELVGYSITKKLSTQSGTELYRGYCLTNRRPVLVKILRNKYPGIDEIARIKHAFQVSQGLNLHGIVKAYSLEKYKGGLALIQEDHQGNLLENQYVFRDMDLKTFLVTARAIAETLRELHQRHVIHNNITPATISRNPETGMVKLSGFLYASLLSQEEQIPTALERLEGSLPYIPPEQTGRLNRPLDYRADFYSLGVTLYEMLTGRLPFRTSDPMTLMHYQVACEPTPPHEVNPKIPTAVSAIVTKLMRKEPEERYQSCYGLIQDLTRCIEQLEAGRPIEHFVPGDHDLVDQFTIPARLFGRETETRTLTDALGRVAEGDSELVLITGPQGSGKTALARELQQHVVTLGGYFVSGNSDLYNKNAPYASLIQAVQELVTRVLTENRERLATWKQQLLEALGDHAGNLIDMVPELEWLLGPQPKAAFNDESQEHVRNLFKMLFRVFPRQGKPLVILLDDLQPAERATQTMIQHLLTEPGYPHLLIVITTREQPGSPAMPALPFLMEGLTPSAAITNLRLSPLDQEPIETLLAETLHQDHETVKPLADITWEKTRGNPFFLRLFLNTLHEKGLISFDWRRTRWVWDLGGITAESVTDNVVSLTAEKLRRLPEAAREALKLAACLGNHFDLRTLAIAMDKNEQAVLADMWEALQQHLILPVDQAHKFLPDMPPGETEDPLFDHTLLNFKFLHNRVQQAAYSLIDESGWETIHLEIGRRLRDRLNTKERADRAFLLVNQLNFAANLIDDPAERRELAELNLTAARKARQTGAFDFALECLSLAADLMGETDPKANYATRFAILRELAECEVLTGKAEQAEAHFKDALSFAQSDRDRVLVYKGYLLFYVTNSRFSEAIEKGLEGLRMLGVTFPSTPRERRESLQMELDNIRPALELDGLVRLQNPTIAMDPGVTTKMRMLMHLIPPALAADVELFKLVALKMAALTLQHGATPYASFAIAALGLILAGRGQYQLGQTLGRIAAAGNHRDASPVIAQRVHIFRHAYLEHWCRPQAASTDALRKAHAKTRESGDFIYANFISILLPLNRFTAEDHLTGVLAELEEHLAITQRTGSITCTALLQLLKHAILNLRGRTLSDRGLSSGSFKEKAAVSALEQRGHAMSLTIYYTLLMTVHYINGHQEEAQQAARACEALAHTLQSMRIAAHYHFFNILIAAAAFNDASQSEKLVLIDTITRGREVLEKGSQLHPENFRHQLLLARAESLRIKGRRFEALEGYRDAIQAAEMNGAVLSQALAHEIAGRFCHEHGFREFAASHMAEACAAYLSWGAENKVRTLEFHPVFSWERDHRTNSHEPYPFKDWDLAAIMKAGQALSEEIVLVRLLPKLMDIVIENAGAQRGALVLKKDECFTVEVQATVEDGRTTVLPSVPLAEHAGLPHSVIQFVARTKKDLLLADVGLHENFIGDPYFQANQVKSVLCTPLFRQKRFLGVLYLENRLAAGVFNQERLEILNILSPQIAISLENARLYTEMQTLNQTLRQEVEERVKAEEELRRTEEVAIKNAVAAGKAEFATNVLHNTKNVLNSVRLAGMEARRIVETSNLKQLFMAVDLLESQGDKVLTFLNENPRGRLIPEYLIELSKLLRGEQEMLISELGAIDTKIALIRDIVETQQTHAREQTQIEDLPLEPIIEEALEVRLASLERGHVKIRRDLKFTGRVTCQRTQLTHVLINLLKNATEAMLDTPEQNRVLTLRSGMLNPHEAFLSISDTGTGIAPDNLTRMFTRGFTTKEDGHGFGLHYCERAMKSMGGAIRVESDGLNMGSRFILTLLAGESLETRG